MDKSSKLVAGTIGLAVNEFLEDIQTNIPVFFPYPLKAHARVVFCLEWLEKIMLKAYIRRDKS